MTYSQFKKAYTETFERWNMFEPGSKESHDYAERMADLEELNPEWASQVEEEAPKPSKIHYKV